MMKDFLEKTIIKNCPHCDPKSFALKHLLKETGRFWVVCDAHPLVEGHILIVPKKHLSCVGEYDKKSLDEFNKLYSAFSNFIKNRYGSVSSFEHGKIGQTIFHSHIHLLPFEGTINEIIPEGRQYRNRINNISQLKGIFEKDGKYLFVSIANQMWTIDPKLGEPRFFRDRFAGALGVPQRANWKEMHQDNTLMFKATIDIENLKSNWKKYGN